ncbi:MAG: alpha/beta hydrolase [Tissierella sp.]|nr:alpha/beta hydrolase [Tissierella sp.]
MGINENIESTLVLSDGRKLAYQEYGDLEGYPILLFHGTPGSRLWFMEDEPIASELGIRLITLDRPGYGGSDPKPYRTMLDWAEDVNETAQLLKLKEYSVLGVSGGGAYAAVCAYKELKGLRNAAMVASGVPFKGGKAPTSMSRPNRIIFWLSRYVPQLSRSVFRAQIKMMNKDPEGFKKSLLRGNRHLSEWDRAFLQTNEQAEATLLHMQEAYRQGPDEVVRESALLSRSWNFKLSGIQIPIYVFHGDADTMAPYDAAAAAVASIPNGQLIRIRNAGHFIIEDEEIWKDILRSLRDGR